MKLGSFLILLFAIFAIFVSAEQASVSDAIKAELKQSEIAIEGLTNSVRIAKEETTAKVSSLVAEVESLKKTIAALQEQNAKLKASPAESTGSYDARISKLDQIVAALRVQVFELREAITESAMWPKVVKYYQTSSEFVVKYYKLTVAKTQEIFVTKVRPTVEKFVADATPIVRTYSKKAVDFATPYAKAVDAELRSSPFVQVILKNGLDFKKYDFKAMFNMIKESFTRQAAVVGAKLGNFGIPKEHTLTAGMVSVASMIIFAVIVFFLVVSFVIKAVLYVVCCCPSNKRKPVASKVATTPAAKTPVSLARPPMNGPKPPSSTKKVVKSN